MKRLLSALLAVAACAAAPAAAADDKEEDGVDPIDAILDDRFADDPEYLEFQREWEEMEANDPDGEDRRAWNDLRAREKAWLEGKRDEIKSGPSEEINQEILEALEAAINEDDDEDDDGDDDDGDDDDGDDDDGDDDDGDDDDGAGIAGDGADPGADDVDGSAEIPKMPDDFVEKAARNLTLDSGPDPAAGCR